MIFSESALAGAFVIDPERRGDERGYFARTFCAREFADQASLIDYARNQLNSNTVVLIKGSRGAGMDRVVNELQAKEER